MKAERQAKIIELIETYQIETQEELADKLGEAGFKTTQATVSRDIRELRLSKMSDGAGHHYYAILRENSDRNLERYARVLKDSIIFMDTARNILVIKTVEGMAQGVGSALDKLSLHEIIGCIGGDDTIMCACRSSEECMHVMNRINQIIQ